ncbi:glycosyltransferase family 2 protein [Pseudooceanicola sp. HF7]|uniref:glycosyltransferase family 2 protein n=1 Tax=Pseudooceanicola sp. HF7 TaxID=2721560 RepID=UPI001431F552|nr:glycosyltransferase family 2 protein [Pseudooceanicola sp. HF7]NIZ08538.1 glycosyltransferase family 2 protein [Pseudooceanicola sp. HF7]
MIVVSLSTIPPRFNMLGRTLRAILDQRHRVDVIRVNIPETYRRFPDHEFTRPPLPEGVTLSVGDMDFGPATKVLPALQDYRDRNDVRIIYCDDDRVPHPDWVGSLIAASNARPDDCIANAGWNLSRIGIPHAETRQPRAQALRSRWDLPYRLRRLRQTLREKKDGRKYPKPARSRNFSEGGYIDIAEGYAGVLVRPAFFDARVFDVPAKLWTVDDIWLSGMLEAAGTGIWGNAKGSIPPEQDDAFDDALFLQVIEGLDRSEANAACARFLQSQYGIWQPEA